MIIAELRLCDLVLMSTPPVQTTFSILSSSLVQVLPYCASVPLSSATTLEAWWTVQEKKRNQMLQDPTGDTWIMAIQYLSNATQYL